MKKTLLTLLFLCGASILFGQPKLLKDDKDRHNTAIVIADPDVDSLLKDRKHELVPTIAAKKDGSVIYAAWYVGGRGEGSGNLVTVAISIDNGQTWMRDKLIVYPKSPSSDRFFDPVLWRDSNDDIWLFYAVSQHGHHWDLRGGINAIKLDWDGKKIKYSVPKLISYGVMMTKPIEVEEIAQTLFPISVWDFDHDWSKDEHYIGGGTFVYSSPLGKNSPTVNKELEPYASIKHLPMAARIYDEHQIAQIQDGEFLLLLRGKAGLYSSRSYDYGKTWTPYESFTAAGTAASSRFYIGRLNSGNLILVMNASTSRSNMTVFVSEDGGLTWPYSLLIDHRSDVSYPDVSQTDDGTIHLTFDRDRYGAKEIWYCRFTEQDVKNKDVYSVFRLNINQK